MTTTFTNILNKKTALLIIAPLFFLKVAAQNIDIAGPSGSTDFGHNVVVLPNGNFLVVDTAYASGGFNRGAVYLYNGKTLQLISSLKGAGGGDRAGSGGIKILKNGNYLVLSPSWSGGRGAVTWCNAATGLNANISNTNSLVGNATDENVGTIVKTLNNGNYLMATPNWNSARGAVTWGNGNSGVTGLISATNSLTGSFFNDQVGADSLIELSNGNYVVVTPTWSVGAGILRVGAVTWGDGATGVAGAISSSNSITGQLQNDRVGSAGIVKLDNGGFVVVSPNWAVSNSILKVGAVTWGNGSSAITGVVSAANSLVGSKDSDSIGGGGVKILKNGNYIVLSPLWDGTGVVQINAGAITWCNKNTGLTGAVSTSNSLIGNGTDNRLGAINAIIGSNVLTLQNGNYVVVAPTALTAGNQDAGAVTWCNGNTGLTGSVNNSLISLFGAADADSIGSGGVKELANGNYVVVSPGWGNQRGAVTLCNGATGSVGTVSSSNSLVGPNINQRIGNNGVTALQNGNYVVLSSLWSAGRGAATWCNGTTGTTGNVTTANSLTGASANDFVGSDGVTALTNGNYVVVSQNWSGGKGAATWGNGSTGLTGQVTAANSLVGNSTVDNVGSDGVIALSNGNYIVLSVLCRNGGIAAAGAVTWGSGTAGVSGLISTANSLMGGANSDRVGGDGIKVLSNDNYVVISSFWNSAAAIDAGAVTLCSGAAATTGLVTIVNSLTGSINGDKVGSNGVVLLNNKSYVVSSLNWNGGRAAVTWCDGVTPKTGVVSSSNSFVSGNPSSVGTGGILEQPNGNYLILSPTWNGKGAVSFGPINTGITGPPTSCNSILGTVNSEGPLMSTPVFDTVYNYSIVGRPGANIVTIYNPTGFGLALDEDSILVNITSLAQVAVPFTLQGQCRIIATLKPANINPVTDSVAAKCWVENTVPEFNNQPFVARHFQVTPNINAATARANVTLYFSQQEFTDFNNHPGSISNLPTGPADASGISNLRIIKYPGTSLDYSGLPGSYAATPVEINPADSAIVWNPVFNRWEVSVDVQGFSGFFVQTPSSVLPLRLLQFSGNLVQDDAKLKWTTENELNTDEFIVERSIDAVSFIAVGNVKANNTMATNNYYFTDAKINNLGAPVIFYRLKQVDIDGHFVYSPVISLRFADKTDAVIYPNPAVDKTNLVVTLNKADDVQARLVDNSGRVLKQFQWKLQAGKTILPIDVSHLAKGVYYLLLKGNTIDTEMKLIKQ